MHKSVLTKEVIENLAPRQNENFIDATAGFGGHAELILEKTSPKGKLLAIDQDPIALSSAKEKLAKFGERVSFANENFTKLGLLVRDWGVEEINGILFDLGVSTYQFMGSKRGFSFREEEELDMRMSPLKQSLTAKEIVNKWDYARLKEIFKNYGEEQNAGKIAKLIVEERESSPIVKTGDLVRIIQKAKQGAYQKNDRIHFATQTFQALRIAVNDELEALKSGLVQAAQVLSPGGRIAMISFHSLEDRIVKRFFAENERFNVTTKKPISATAEEIASNPSARSAKLRVAEKIK